MPVGFNMIEMDSGVASMKLLYVYIVHQSTCLEKTERIFTRHCLMGQTLSNRFSCKEFHHSTHLY